jgi:hypothetical protein
MNFAIGISLEGGNIKRGTELAFRLAWIGDSKQTIEQVLKSNHLPPILSDSTVFDMTVGRCAIASLNGEYSVVARRQKYLWSVIGKGSEKQVTALELQERFLNIKFSVMPLVRGWQPTFRLYGRIEDALCNRLPEEHVFAVDWSTKGTDSKRFLLCSEQRIDDLVQLLQDRPRCDTNVYTVNMGGFRMRLIQLDIEATLNLNTHLKTEAAQDAYVNDILNHLRRFLNAELRDVLVTFASDDARFSAHAYILYDLDDQKAHDTLVVHFWEWLWTQPSAQHLLIHHRFPPNKTLGQGFAIDVLAGGRNREMRGPMQGKKGKRHFRLSNHNNWNMETALRFVLPNQLIASPPPPNLEEEVYTAKYRRNDNGEEVELCNTSGRPPPEETFLYNYPAFYNFLSPYAVLPSEKKRDVNVFWMQEKRPKQNDDSEKHVLSSFAVPWNKYAEFLRLQANCAFPPPLLHEACYTDACRPRRANCDIDGTRLSPEEVARVYTHFSKSNVSIKVAPPNPKDAPGLNRFHLIAFGGVLSGARAQYAHRWHFDQWMRAHYSEELWPHGCLDMNPTDLRMLGSDKPVERIGTFSNRVLVSYGYYDLATDQYIECNDPIQQQHMCSIHACNGQVVNLEFESQTLFTPEYVEEIKGQKASSTGDPYDASNEQHRAIATELSQMISTHYTDFHGNIKIESVEKEANGTWVAYVGHFCINLNQQIVEGKKKMTPGRASPYEHIWNRGGFRFHPTHITPFCSDKECKKSRELPYTNSMTQRILFSKQEEGEEEVVNDVEEEIVALNYIREQEGSNDGWKHYPRLHAYWSKASRFVKVPHDCYTDADAPDALLFHAFAPDEAVAFSNNVFTLRNGQKVPLVVGGGDPVLHRVHHIRRMRGIFHSLKPENVLFDQVPRLWDYDLRTNLSKRETWYTFSGKGTGKTFQNIRIIGNQNVAKPRITQGGCITWNPNEGVREARVLILSPLIAVAAFYALADKYDAANYDDDYFRTHPHMLQYENRLVCSFESLHKLPVHYEPDIVLMDESEWLLQIFSGTTMADCRQQSWARFRSIIRKAKLVVASDSRLAKKTYNCLHELRQKSTERLFYNFRAENGNAYTHYSDEAAWFDQLKAAIQRRDGPIFLPTSGKDQGLLLRKFIEQLDPDGTILFISGDTYHSDPQIAYSVSHCNEEWVKYQYVIMTPVVGPAVDFNVKYFRYCFAWATPLSGTPAQFFQMIGRVRHLINEHVHYFVSRGGWNQRKKNITEESVRSSILKSAKDTARLGIQLTEDETWNVIQQAYENGVYDKLFFDIHVANLYEEKLGKMYFPRELALLIKEQQGRAPNECTTKGAQDQCDWLKQQRKAHNEEKANIEWNAFATAPEISVEEATAVDQEIKRGIHVDAVRLQSRNKRKFRNVYALEDDQEITRDQFEADNPNRRLALRDHEEAVVRPRIEQLLTPHDQGRLVDVVKRQRTIADLQYLKAYPRQQQEHVLRIFGFPHTACVAQVLHDLSPHLHPVTPDYCEHLMVLDQLKLLELPDFSLGKKATGITWFRSFVEKHWDVHLVATQRIRKRYRDAQRIDGEDALDIVQRHFPNYNHVPPPSRFIVEQFPVSSSMEEDVWRAFVLAFSPRHLAAFPRNRCVVENNGFVPIFRKSNVSPLDFPQLCKKNCPDGVLLSFTLGHLYYQYEQFWTLEANGTCTQHENANDAAHVFPSGILGHMYIAPVERPQLILREAPSWNIVSNWPARFLKYVVIKD